MEVASDLKRKLKDFDRLENFSGKRFQILGDLGIVETKENESMVWQE